MRRWRDLMTSFFLRIFGTQKSVNWIYTYKIDWDVPLAAYAPESDKNQGQPAMRA